MKKEECNLTAQDISAIEKAKRIRIVSNMTQSQFAEATGLSLATIKKYKSYASPVTPFIQQRLDNYLRQSSNANIESKYFNLYSNMKKLINQESVDNGTVRCLTNFIEDIFSTENLHTETKRREYLEFVYAVINNVSIICEIEKSLIRDNTMMDWSTETKRLSKTISVCSSVAYKNINKKNNE